MRPADRAGWQRSSLGGLQYGVRLQGYAPSDLEQAVRLFDGFVKREDISVATDIVEPQSQTFVQLPSSAGMEDQLARFKQEIETINKELRRSRDELHQAREAVAAETAQKNKLQREVRTVFPVLKYAQYSFEDCGSKHVALLGVSSNHINLEMTEGGVAKRESLVLRTPLGV